IFDAIDAFKENYPLLLKKEFSLAKVLICYLHLKKYLRTEMSTKVYGGRDAVTVDRVGDADETEYDRGLRYMFYLLDSFDEKGRLLEPKHPLLVYFMRNWHARKDMWAVYERGHIAHLGNHTNNRYAVFFLPKNLLIVC
ncbi:hypothetical protein JG688_00003300, partial [Phytophthora aleatoria]